MREFLDSVGDLSLHEMKVLFSERYQGKIEFSYYLQTETNCIKNLLRGKVDCYDYNKDQKECKYGYIFFYSPGAGNGAGNGYGDGYGECYAGSYGRGTGCKYGKAESYCGNSYGYGNGYGRKQYEVMYKTDPFEREMKFFYAAVDNKMGTEAIFEKGRDLYRELHRFRREKEALEVLKNMLLIMPDDKSLQSQYIAHCFSVDISEAVFTFERIADKHEKRGNLEETIHTYIKILKLERERKDVEKKLQIANNKNKFFFRLSKKFGKK